MSAIAMVILRANFVCLAVQLVPRILGKYNFNKQLNWGLDRRLTRPSERLACRRHRNLVLRFQHHSIPMFLGR